MYIFLFSEGKQEMKSTTQAHVYLINHKSGNIVICFILKRTALAYYTGQAQKHLTAIQIIISFRVMSEVSEVALEQTKALSRQAQVMCALGLLFLPAFHRF